MTDKKIQIIWGCSFNQVNILVEKLKEILL